MISGSREVVVPLEGFPIPRSKVTEYKTQLQHILNNPKNFTIAEQSEANERYGISLFYYGSYFDSITFLSQALVLRKDEKVNRSNIRINVLLGIASIRMGDPTKALTCFAAASTACKQAKNNDYIPYCKINSAVAKIYLNKFKDAIDSAREALEAISHLYSIDSREVSTNSL